MECQKIGSLNGKWSILFRAVLACGAIAMPLVIAFQSYILMKTHEIDLEVTKLNTRVESFISEGPRYTPADARADGAILTQKILEIVSKNYPPEWLQKEIESIGRRVEVLEQAK